MELLPPRERPMQPSYFFPSLLLFLVTAPALPPGRWRTLFTFPIMLSYLLALFNFRTADIFGNEYAMGCWVIIFFFYYLDLVCLENPDREHFRPVGGEGPGARTKPARPPQAFRQRWWWSLQILVRPRGFGWSHQVKNVPDAPSKGHPRWRFILKQAWLIAWYWLLMTVIKHHDAASPYGRFSGTGKETSGFTTEPLLFRCLMMWKMIAIMYFQINFLLAILHFGAVALHIWSPEECPPLFGDLRDAYTVRRAWSITWHQLLRRVVTVSSNFIVRDTLRLPVGTLRSRYTQLFTSFLVSGLIHSGGSIYANPTGVFQDRGDMLFMLAQPLAIASEEALVHLGRKHLGLKDGLGWRLLGYLWTLMWFGVSMQIFTSPGSVPGLWEHQFPGELLGVGRVFERWYGAGVGMTDAEGTVLPINGSQPTGLL